MPLISFLGAALQVTGSCYLIDTGSHRVLLECGMTQGEFSDDNQEDEFPFDPCEINAVILSHAHLDHSGLIPLLVHRGFKGSIYLTQSTLELLPIMHKDAAYLQAKDVEWENKRRQRAGKPLLEPSYTVDDVEQEISLCKGLEYGVKTEFLQGVSLRFLDAGHILGSAIVELWVGKKKLVFSGDLGNSSSPLLKDPAIVDHADILLLESTYGDRNHRPHEETLGEFRQVLDDAAEGGGNVLIPAFAVGRTQDVLYHLGALYHQGKLQQKYVFLDSPMAISVSRLYQENVELFNSDNPEFRKTMSHAWEQWLPILRNTQETKESMALNNISEGAIIIAGSGMCTGGRIRHHLKYNLWRSKSHVMIVGYQARGTLGRKLVDGAKLVRILGSEIAVKAKIHTLGGFSAHAGQDQLLEWASHMNKSGTALYLVHGEPESMQALQGRFRKMYDWHANIPEKGDVVEF